MDNFMKPIIETYYSQLETQLENEILKGVQSVGVQVDKERLLQALKDAKEFWHEGYKDGYRAAVWEQPRWISVEERLPELESFVLCRLKGFQYGGNTQVCRYRAADKYVDHPYFDHYRNGFPCVTHWMPLPDAPEVEV